MLLRNIVSNNYAVAFVIRIRFLLVRNNNVS